MHDKHYVSDAIINHGIVKDNELDCEPYTRLFLGRDYELLRKPFLQPIRGLKRNNNVVISFGGADPLHLTERFVSLLLMIKIPYHIITLIGDKTYLSEENREKVEIRKNLTAQQVADLFETSAFGIFSASSVSLEAMSRELPIMIGYYVDNQKEGYERFMSRGSFIPLDYLPDLSKEKLVHAIKSLDTFEPSKRDSSAIIDNFKQMFRSL
jgi:spore coat polysaccharide biosynthesis predicted glycosyltransferase SpsG